MIALLLQRIIINRDANYKTGTFPYFRNRPDTAPSLNPVSFVMYKPSPDTRLG